MAQPETARAMAEVKSNPSFVRFEKKAVDVLMIVEHRKLLGIHVRMDIAGTEMFKQQLIVTAFGQRRLKIDHAGESGARGSFDGRVDGSPSWMCRVKGLADPVMRRFDAHDIVGVSFSDFGNNAGMKMRGLIFRIHVYHAAVGDIEEGKHTSFGAVDEFLLHAGKILPAACACIYSSGHTILKHVCVGMDGRQTVMRKGESRIAVAMHVDETGVT